MTPITAEQLELVERLRWCSTNPNPWRRPYVRGILKHAAAELEKSVAEVERLREALRKIAGGWVDGADDIPDDEEGVFCASLQAIARAALEDGT